LQNKIIIFKEDFKNLLNEKDLIQNECEKLNKLNYKLKTNSKKYQKKIEFIEKSIQTNKEYFESILIQKDKKYNDILIKYNDLKIQFDILNIKFNSLIEDYENLRVFKVSNI
jgi:hypothetical protein